MLFKEILEQPVKGSSNSKVGKGRNPNRKIIRKPSERKSNVVQKVKHLNAPKKTLSSCQIGAKTSKIGSTSKRSEKMSTRTKYDSNVPSSTPVFTPIKKDKLPPSITSSQCSLIELLQQYNVSSNSKQSYIENTSLENTLVSKYMDPLSCDEICNEPQMQTFKEVLDKLVRVVKGSQIGENGEIQSAFNDVQAAFKSLPVKEKSVSETIMGPSVEINSKLSNSVNLEELQLENLSLQRKLRLAKKEADHHSSHSKSGDISLEVMTIQCQNKALEKKVSELTNSLEQALTVQQSIMETNNQLAIDNERLQSELFRKQDELAKSGDLFSVETKEIKKDVGNALQKVECLKLSVEETNKKNEELLREIEIKDKEIFRLTDLNKGLQGSVSRLLEDLNSASKSDNTHFNSAVLKKLDNILSSPPHQDTKNNYLIRPTVDSTSKQPQFITPTNKASPPAKHFFPQYNSLQSSGDNQGAVLESDVNGSCSVKSVVGSSLTPSLPNTNSVSSSMWSITSRDERDFNAGLASLDADIQRLQNSLFKFNV